MISSYAPFPSLPFFPSTPLFSPTLGAPLFPATMTPLPSPPANADATAREQAERQLDSLLDAWMTPPEGLAQRICARCREEAEEEEFLGPVPVSSRRRGWGQALLSLAACLCLLASATVLLRGRGTEASSPEAVSVLPSPVAVRPWEAPSSLPALSQEQQDVVASLPLRERGFSFQDDLLFRRRTPALPPQNVTAVSARGGFSAASSNVTPLPAAEREVTHVWLAPKMLSQEKLQEFLTRNPVLAQGSAVPDDHGVYTLSLQAMDTEIQHTVDVLFRDLHWKLLSPDSPQPGQGDKTPVTGKPIRYTLKIIPQK